ncbi:MAG TPA: hypothetical protein PKK26_02250 [Candidatus Wallbacteria bacterium]|nr:hypothetical protein [Candidatus Wallbacteria bacterium]
MTTLKKTGKNIKLTGVIKALGDNVNTDTIHNPQKFTIDKKKLGVDVLRRAETSGKDIVIIAGRNVGIGSSRFSTVVALKNSGVVAVAAPSISRIFERNLACAGIFPIKLDEARPAKNIKRIEYSEILINIIPGDGLYSARLYLNGEKEPLLSGTVDGYLLDIAASGGMIAYMKIVLSCES